MLPPPQVAVERLLKTKAHHAADPPPSPWHSPPRDPPPDPSAALGRPLLQPGVGGGGGGGGDSPPPPPSPPPLSLHDTYRDLYDFFGDSLALRFGTGVRPPTPTPNPPGTPEKEPYGTEPGGGPASNRKMPQLTASSSPPPDDPQRPTPRRPSPAFPRGIRGASGASRPAPVHRLGIRDVFQKCRFSPRGSPRFSFLIAGRQTGRRCPGRRFQTVFGQHHSPAHVAARYAQKLPVIGRAGRAARRRVRAEYSLLFLL